ncbi:MAG: 3-deoxy-8-phosphooctulonate synthase [Kiritimatiellae bacterium]|nr:3-deoxy-8-phosphooctulonate synthase [Kiritimatiellia bacterium]MBR4946185.1 3-deoxy-8-phosphooctulonate synthase [Kiritimatiellia bacterium]MBR5587249.1 3-deoxy-8-phosphooctulonate synthase [Kiritimatiellia bacterium]
MADCKIVQVTDTVSFGTKALTLMAGPCVIESHNACLELAEALVGLTQKLGIPYIFKASFDKANRTSLSAYRGPGLEKGLETLAEVKSRFNVPIVTDIHEPWQCEPVAEVCDVLQIPAFLCRQTDLVVAAAKTGRVINVKKGQFMAPEDMVNVVRKIESEGNNRIVLIERGASFGYHNLVADMRSLLVMRELGYPVVFDATHSVQRPGGLGTGSGGDGRWAPALARAAVATGVDGLFMETHFNPPEALSDAANAIAFSALEDLLTKLQNINNIVKA